jgi:drug/metabolite transporter (DMT)-like permease
LACLAAAVCVAGVVLVAFGDRAAESHNRDHEAHGAGRGRQIQGDLLAALSALCAALYMVVFHERCRSMPPAAAWTVLGLVGAWGAALGWIPTAVAATAAAASGSGTTRRWDKVTIAAMAGAVLGSAMFNAALNVGMTRGASPLFMRLCTVASIPATLAIDAWLIGDPATPLRIAGAVACVAGVVLFDLASSFEAKKRTAAAS